ncbi:MAG: UvrD-helicase domain-containing protein, partial [Pseudomonadota bacterium]
ALPISSLGVALKLAKSNAARAAEALAEALLVKSGPRAGEIRARLPTKDLKHANPGLAGQVEDLADLAIRLRETVLAHAAAARTTDLHVFARSLLKRYAAAKDARALLDFEDLVSRTRDLLSASDLRAWVLYKLDSGLDHVLVDEAQDTSPQQWEVISAITDDFHSGGRDAGAGTGLNRSIFVVGDEKQSIYSFQGAEPTAFGSMRTRLADRLEAIGDELRRPALITSFRSAPQILDFVDAVFEGAEAHGVTYTGDAIRHEAYRSGDPGRIDLWPLVERREDPDEGPWWEPVDRPPRDDPRIRLADALALEIRRMIAEDWLPDRAGQPRRRVSPGSILVLVRRRDRLARRLIDALKARDVPVSGSDRLSLAEELAVRDILALIRAVLAPADDLSLAEALRSPLGSFSEDDLFDLAHDRAGSLRAALSERRDRFERDADMIDDLALKAGFLGPYEYLERILIHHDGRRRLLARLGPEAEDCIDELLAQALAFEARETPTLIGFVAWIEAGDVTLKREMEKGTDEVRVMTIHGAKGLEAPVVILPDTVNRAAGSARPVLLPNDPGAENSLIIWAGKTETDDRATTAARTIAKAREEAEAKRLLYVGLTRAEDWLILCGAGKRQDADKSWYGRLEAAAVAFGGQPDVAPDGLDGVLTRIGPALPETSPAGPSSAAQVFDEHVRDPWISRAPREARLRRIAPSSLAPKVGRSAYGDLEDPEQARLRGLAVHALLERLPEIPDGDRETHVDQILAEFIPHLPDELITEVRGEANAVLNERSFADLFGPESLGET